MRSYFVTGTGTGVGKTFVTSNLARLARARKLRVFAFKPMETGCTFVDGAWVGADQQLLCNAAGDWQRGELRGVYMFEPPVAPLVAAEQAGVEIDLVRIQSVLAQGSTNAELVLVEGAGGWRVPITPTLDMAGLARTLGFPVIVVGHATLGTINHSLLTIEAIERDGHRVEALVLSKRPEDDHSHVMDNVKRIEALWRGQVLVHVEPADLASLL